MRCCSSSRVDEFIVFINTTHSPSPKSALWIWGKDGMGVTQTPSILPHRDSTRATTPANPSLLLSYPVISTRISPFSRSSIAFCKLVARISFIFVFEVFPQVTQIIFGGTPSLFCSSRKSLSLVITDASASRAEKNMT